MMKVRFYRERIFIGYGREVRRYKYEMNPKSMTDIKNALEKAWSIQSSSKWAPNNPAARQCGVTALVVHDLLGGEILKTQLLDGWHFYNALNGQRHDFTESQFSAPITYLDVASNRAEAFADTNQQQYEYLKQAVMSQMPS
jgi:hypothetical protein